MIRAVNIHSSANKMKFYVSNAMQTLYDYEMHGFQGISNLVLFANFMRTWIGNLRLFWKVCAMLRARVKYKALEQRATCLFGI